MKSTTLLLAVFGALNIGLQAAPLTEATPVYAKADATSTVLATLKAGTEPVITVDGSNVPAGWTAVTLAGPHEVYASNKDVSKALDVRPGSPYLTEPKTGSPVFAIAEKGDQTEIIDYRGKWTKFRLSKPVTGFIKSPAKPATPPAPAAKSPATAPAAAVTPAPVKDAPTTAAAPTPAVVNIGRAAPVGDGGSSVLPRLFQGKFASTYHPLRPRRPYEFQLTDDAGARYAYVDISKLLATEQLNKYVDRTVVVYGTARSVPGSTEMVVVAESLQLR
ncbi:MAG: hypothetical protein H2172_05130 [Opitutus sp.]|nr:hypothetical protein [Opitutus sp.]MCS6247850.1 hypothetical protein [Opitutus sp.]MCS6274169.1 hypothetical protein [Opitutus sp.]MCS6278943.1 hypothetical protein [Opitutus sp.]MCS6298693.1 hypothetical protein [Opitutus sp.]